MEGIPKAIKREQLNPAKFEGREPAAEGEMRLDYGNDIDRIREKARTNGDRSRGTASFEATDRSAEMRLEVEPDEASKIARIKERLQAVREEKPNSPEEWRRELTRIIDRGSVGPVSKNRVERVLTKNEQSYFALKERVKELETQTGLSETPANVKELETKRSMLNALGKAIRETGEQNELRTAVQRSVERANPIKPLEPIKKQTTSFFNRFKNWFKNPFGI